MNSSLPLITPRDSHALWYTPSSTFSFAPPTQTPYNNLTVPPNSLNAVSQGQNQHSRPRNAGISPLAQLELDEQSVALRKLNIQRFGATWIRPPGMQKTYQGELDEKAEREEAEAQEMLDAGMAGGEFDLDEEGQALHANTDLDANIPDGGDVSDLDNIPEGDSFVDGAEDDEDEEVDLDDDVPEAEAETLWDSSDEEEDDEEEDDDDEEDETGYASAAAISTSTSTVPDTESVGAAEESPQLATFSYDERYPDDRRQRARQEYEWRARGRYRHSMNDSMEMDSE